MHSPAPNVETDGSSALHQALMSSPKVGTMCAGNHWQCEVSLRTGAGSRCHATPPHSCS